MKKGIFYLTLVSLVVLLAGCAAQAAPGFTSSHTIKTGKLRATTFSLVSSAENSTTKYRQQYRYIQDIGDGRGYTAGIIGFTSGTGDLRQVVKRYVHLQPHRNRLKKYLPALKRAVGSDTHRGLGKAFMRDWRSAAKTHQLVQAQNDILNQQYMAPVLKAAKQDDLSPLGQYIYYDAIVVHGPGNDRSSFGGIRRRAMKLAKTPHQGGSQAQYLRAFLKVRASVMRQEKAHKDLSRINVQRQFLEAENYQLRRPLHWTMYGDRYRLN